MLTAAAALGTTTVPGQVESVRQARAFVGSILGPTDPRGDTARLLVSELVTNAVQHSESRRPGGAVTVTVTESDRGIRVEVTDDGSAYSVPVVRDDVCATHGRGLLMVQSLADDWGYLRDGLGTTVWFRLAGLRVRRLTGAPAPRQRWPGEIAAVRTPWGSFAFSTVLARPSPGRLAPAGGLA